MKKRFEAFKSFMNRFKSDRGDSLVTALIVFPMTISIIISGIDYAMFLNNRSIIQNAARDGARTVSILGGNNDRDNKIANRYGINDKNKNIGTNQFATGTYSGGSYMCGSNRNAGGSLLQRTAIECEIEKNLKSSPLVQTEIYIITCDPWMTTRVGQNVFCEVQWQYQGLPLSSLGFTYNNNKQVKGFEDRYDAEGNGLASYMVTRGYASAETANSNG